MLPRLAWLLIASLALPFPALGQAEEEVVAAIRARLETNRRNDMTTWATFVASKIEPSILDAYVGEYEWAPTLLSKIERQGDRLLERLGPGEPAEMLPESDTTFFIPGAAAGGDASRIIFAKDAGGRVTHYIYRDLGATDRIVRKIR